MAKRVILRPSVYMLRPGTVSGFPGTDAATSDFKNLSDFSQGFEFTEEIEQHDATTTENDGNVAMLGGLSTWSATLNFLQDFDANKLHALVYPIVSGREEAFFICRPDHKAAISADNRCVIVKGVVASYSPLTAAINSVLSNPISISPGPTNTGINYYDSESAVQLVDGLANFDEDAA